MARSDLRTHPKFRRLVKRLGIPAPYVLGLLETMWQVGYSQAWSLLGDPEDVELAAEWPGEEGVFFAAIKDDWLDLIDGKWHIHDFLGNCPDFVKKRVARRRNKKLGIETADDGGHSDENDRRADDDRQTEDAGRSQTATVPNPTQPNPTPNTPQPPGGAGGGMKKSEESSQKGESSGTGSAKRKPAEMPPMPQALAVSPEFVAAWADWCEHRRESKKALTPLSVKEQYRTLAELGPERAVYEIRRAIRGGWQGIHPEPAPSPARHPFARQPRPGVIDEDPQAFDIPTIVHGGNP